MFILKKGHQPGVYVPLRALFLVAGCNAQIVGFFTQQLILCMSLVVRKPLFWVSNQVRHKWGCAITEDG